MHLLEPLHAQLYYSGVNQLFLMEAQLSLFQGSTVKHSFYRLPFDPFPKLGEGGSKLPSECL